MNLTSALGVAGVLAVTYNVSEDRLLFYSSILLMFIALLPRLQDSDKRAISDQSRNSPLQIAFLTVLLGPYIIAWATGI